MSPRPNSFTLIELLIVVGVVAILSVAVVMALNPTQLMAQGRDATRLNDLDTLNHALTLYGAERSAFGSSNTIYVSVPDPTIATTNGTSTCSGLGLSTTNLPAGWTYQCASTSSVQDTDGTGWLPVNFTQMTSKPLSQLPLDPVNTTSSGNYYTYVTNGSQWELTSIAESQKYKSQTNSKTPFQPGLLAQGSNLALSPLFNSSGLIGYWPMDEGTGTIAYDQSGSGNGGTWSGNTPYYAGAKVGAYAGKFDGATDYMNVSDAGTLNPNNLTVSAWVYFPSNNGNLNIIAAKGGDEHHNFKFGVDFRSGANSLWWEVGDGSLNFYNLGPSLNLIPGRWYHLVGVYNNSNFTLSAYLNGAFLGSSAIGTGIINDTTPLFIGRWLSPTFFFNGSIDDVRIYNRALSSSEIQAIYNATK